MIRRLINWLARKEIARAYEAGALMERALSEANMKLCLDMAFAKGELFGQQQALDAIDKEAMGRTVSSEDVAKARKGSRH